MSGKRADVDKMRTLETRLRDEGRHTDADVLWDAWHDVQAMRFELCREASPSRTKEGA